MSRLLTEAEEEFEALFNSIVYQLTGNKIQLSPKNRKLYHKALLLIYNKKLVERKFAPVIWDCVDQTALSQADLEDKEVSSNELLKFWRWERWENWNHDYPVELLPACVALMINANHEEEDGSKKWQKYLR